jgi:hypothetical protein
MIADIQKSADGIPLRRMRLPFRERSPANYSDLPVPYLNQRVPSAPTSSVATRPVFQPVGFFSREEY